MMIYVNKKSPTTITYTSSINMNRFNIIQHISALLFVVTLGWNRGVFISQDSALKPIPKTIVSIVAKERLPRKVPVRSCTNSSKLHHSPRSFKDSSFPSIYSPFFEAPMRSQFISTSNYRTSGMLVDPTDPGGMLTSPISQSKIRTIYIYTVHIYI